MRIRLSDKNLEIIGLYQEQKSLVLVGKVFGISRQRVHQILKKYYALNGIPLPGRPSRYPNTPCLGCDRIFGVDVNHHNVSHGYCSRCIGRIRKGTTDLKMKIYKSRTEACIICQDPFLRSRYHSGGMCTSCYGRERFKDPVKKAAHRARVKEWGKKNPEKIKFYARKSQKKYYLKIKALDRQIL